MADRREALLKGLLHLGCVEISEPEEILSDPQWASLFQRGTSALARKKGRAERRQHGAGCDPAVRGTEGRYVHQAPSHHRRGISGCRRRRKGTGGLRCGAGAAGNAGAGAERTGTAGKPDRRADAVERSGSPAGTVRYGAHRFPSGGLPRTDGHGGDPCTDGGGGSGSRAV